MSGENLSHNPPQPSLTPELRPNTRVYLLIAFSIFFTGILYYCFAYLLRVYPSVMISQIRSHFHISAGDFGLLTSFYYFAYAPMQLPVGMSVDRIGPRKSLLTACFLSTAGAFIFAASPYYDLALAGRFLIGFGAAFAYVTALKIATIWLPRKYFATATGFVTGAGMVAAIFTDMYLTRFIRIEGFKETTYFPFVLGIVLFALIFLLVKDKPRATTTTTTANAEENHALSIKQLIKYLRKIAKNPQMWMIGIVGAFLYLPASVFLDVWGIPYLKVTHHLSAEHAALGVSLMLGGWIISSFMTGPLSELLKTRKLPLVIATFGATIIASIIIFAPIHTHIMLFSLLFALGLFCGPHPLCFTLSKENNSGKISGTAISFANFVIMMGGFVFQPIVGWFLDLGWSGKLAHGLRVYSPSDYTHALAILPICLLLAGVIILFVKDTYHNEHIH